MKSDTPLEYAVFQLSPRRSRCELFVSSDGNTETLASGLVKPFVTHLKVAEEQLAQATQSIKLEVDRHKNADTWFTKGTIERFVRFVSTPEILELVNTFDAEMSQLEAARKIYSQGAGDQHTETSGVDGMGTIPAADATKKELLRAIDVRLVAVREDLTTACAHASAAGFNPDTVSEVQHFADWFGAHRLNEACSKFLSLHQRRPDLVGHWKPRVHDKDVRSSYGSDMSIDDPTEEQTGPNIRAHNKSFDLPQVSTRQQPKSFATFSSRRDNVNENDEAKGEVPSPTESTSTQPTRRLSVQDRINIFESKQKENSGGSGKPICGKPVELRRLSSDVSSGAAPEKAVLRRWSGASDMSLDLSGEKKDIESPLCTPSSASSVPQTKSNTFSAPSEEKGNKAINGSGHSFNAESQSAPSRLKDNAQNSVGTSEDKEEDVTLKAWTGWKDQEASRTKFRPVAGRVTEVNSDDKRDYQERHKFSGVEEEGNAGYKGQGASEEHLGGVFVQTETPCVKTQVASQTRIGAVGTSMGDVPPDRESFNRGDDAEMSNQPVAPTRVRGFHSHSRSFSGQFEGGIGLKPKDASYFQSKKGEGDPSSPQLQWSSFAGELEEVEKKDYTSSVGQQVKIEDSDTQKMKYQKSVSVSREQIRKSQRKGDQSRVASGHSRLDFPVIEVLENQDGVDVTSAASAVKVQRVRLSKGNQELNDELKMKANELEKLFAAHKLRVPGDQSGSVQRSELTGDTQIETATLLQYRKPAAAESTPPQIPGGNTVIEPSGSSSILPKSNTNSIAKMGAKDNYGNDLRQSFSELSFSDDSRGKFYEKYMQRRDAKLREEWSTKRTEKEAKLKAMQDSLEQSRAEMKAKFSGSAFRHDSVSRAHSHAEKLRSFNFRSNTMMEQHPIVFLQNEEDEDLSEFHEDKFYGDSALRSTHGRKIFPNRKMSSSTPRTAVATVSRSSAKVSNSTSGRRRIESESPLAQSVPNFSDLRKENTKPSPGVGKTASRSQVRNYARSKSSNEEIPGVQEEKPKRSQSLRKSSAGPTEGRDIASLTSDDFVLSPLKREMQQIDQGPCDLYSKSMDARSLPRKGNFMGPGAGSSSLKMKVSIASVDFKDGDYNELASEAENSVDLVKEEEDEVEAVATEDSPHMDNGKVRLREDCEKSNNSGSEIGDSTRSLSQVDCTTVTEMPAMMPASFNNAGSQQDSPVESPISWNSRTRHPFSYPHESSDVEASVDSPSGSPASWNSHTLVQSEADAARMRKKWGSAQKPVLVANSSHNQSRKDVTKGFKRLLKFGRKNRGTDSLVDWISATTSEGDDDTEDGRDPANRSSEDLRKSRMGFSQGHPDDSFNESEIFNEQVQSLQSSIPAPPANFKLRDDHISGSSLKAPRSFFSLSTFRSKGSDSKPR